jgi:hypothetical protein
VVVADVAVVAPHAVLHPARLLEPLQQDNLRRLGAAVVPVVGEVLGAVAGRLPLRDKLPRLRLQCPWRPLETPDRECLTISCRINPGPKNS